MKAIQLLTVISLTLCVITLSSADTTKSDKPLAEKVLEKYIEIHERPFGFKEEEIKNIKEEISKIIEGEIERFKQNLAELVD